MRHKGNKWAGNSSSQAWLVRPLCLYLGDEENTMLVGLIIVGTITAVVWLNDRRIENSYYDL